MNLLIYSDRIERLVCDVLVIPIFSDERPLKGIAALLDWRLHGKISKLILNGTINGALSESTLFVPKGCVKAHKILLIGMGPCPALHEVHIRSRFRETLMALDEMAATYAALPISRFTTPTITSDTATQWIYQELIDRASTSKPFETRSIFLIVNDAHEMRQLANTLKQLDKQPTVPVNIEIMDRANFSTELS